MNDLRLALEEVRSHVSAFVTLDDSDILVGVRFHGFLCYYPTIRRQAAANSR